MKKLTGLIVGLFLLGLSSPLLAWIPPGGWGAFMQAINSGNYQAKFSLLNLTPRTAPSSPTNGDMWTTTAGVYARINGVTVGPFVSGASFAYPGVGVAVSTGSAWGTSLNITAISDSTSTTSSTTAASATAVKSAYDLAAGKMGGGVTSVTETSEAATCNWTLGSTCYITGEANTTAWTLTMSNPVAGQIYRVYVLQQTGGPVPLPTLSPTVTWLGSAPTFAGTNTKHDAFACQYLGTTYFCSPIGSNF